MNLIKKDKLNMVVSNDYEYVFEVAEDGMYFIEIIASAKSWWQNFKSLVSFFKDDDLTLKIDNIEFPKINGKAGLFDGEVAWNGNNLKGLCKTNIFIINFNKGSHKLEFLVDQKPFLESIAIYAVLESMIDYIPEENNPAQDGNRRQWMTLVSINLSIKNLNIKAIAKNYPDNGDDDDIKLIIDGSIQKNESDKSHDNWFWCGKILNGQEKEFNQELNLAKGLHYIELWADRSPEIKNVGIVMNAGESAKIIPTENDPEWTGDFGDDSEQIILARAIFGEARGMLEEGKIAVGWSIKNRVLDSRWGDTYHEVILQPKQYSAFNDNDKNLKFVKNPLLSKTQMQAWHECYVIAGEVMNGKVDDPTSGANHYFSDYIDFPYWTKQKNAEFKIKIGNTLFYDLKQQGNGGFIKNAVVILCCVIVLVLGLTYVAVKINNWQDSKNKVFNVWKAERYKHFFINPKTEEIEVAHFNEDGNFLRLRQITSNEYPKSNLNVFSNTEMFGYFQDLHKYEEGYAGNEDEYYKNYVVLLIKNNEYEKPYEVYRGDVHTSSWEWTDKNHVIVYYGCGSNCRYFYKINIVTKDVVEEGHDKYWEGNQI